MINARLHVLGVLVFSGNDTPYVVKIETYQTKVWRVFINQWVKPLKKRGLNLDKS